MVITRFAPSPTGYLHIGGLRTALFSWLWAKHNDGKFLLRIEDTDQARNSDDALKAIIKAFDWVGMSYDGDVVYQSKRFDIYTKYINQLLDEGKAYRCYMSKDELTALREEQMANRERTRYDGRYRDFKGTPPEGVEPVIRIKAPLSGKLEFDDGVKGLISIDANEVDDFVIARADGTPTYNFVVAIDDFEMGLTTVIRGDDHLYNTPKQMVVYNALGFEMPKFYHVAMINNEQGKKLSKRDGATDVMDYKNQGILPEALLNFLVRLGWSHGDQEEFTIEEMIKLFNPKDINKSSSNYNLDKLMWLNANYMKNMDRDRLITLLKDYGLDISTHNKKENIINATIERAKTMLELVEQINLILDTPKEYDAKSSKKAFKGEAFKVLKGFIDELNSTNELDTPANYHSVMQSYLNANELGFGKLGQPLRVALLGKMTGSGLDEIMYILGRDEVIARVEEAIKFINNK
ncbi:Glutamyl-tRNA synthetase [hydrothermal vent metagenome]|uniref:glutamate--tRNA ligase n=1 Tax=hydrothermal vent metagenome TaxID=652676 RepID=A0A1W1EKH3_9ZZZZ